MTSIHNRKGVVVDEIDLESVLPKARLLDDQALSELYKHYYPKIVKFIYYRTAPKYAEDLASDVFVKVIRSIPKQSGNFDAWIYRIARNVMIDKGRHVNSRPEVELSQEYAENVEDVRKQQESVNDAMDIHHALEQLNDEQREFLTLKFIQGLDNKDIADITGKEIGALRAMQFRALKSLKNIFKRGES